MLVAGEAQIANVAVSPAFRRQGIAKALLSALLGELAASGYSAATLEVRPSNAPARALYAGFGFVCEGVRRRFYSDGEDALVLWKFFSESR